MAKPLIGITGRRTNGPAYERRTGLALDIRVDNYFADYARCVAESGGLPIYLPYEAAPGEVLDRVDGVIITGGQDIHPDSWGHPEYAEQKYVDDIGSPLAYDTDRDAHEIEIARLAVELRMPILGVCRGHQVLNVAFGGTLVPHIPDSGIEHQSQRIPFDDGADNHRISFEEGSLARDIFGATLIRNSWHHQAVATCGDGLVATGRTVDGVVESIEWPGRPLLGVQWHPEWQRTADPAFDWLTRCARKRNAHHLATARAPSAAVGKGTSR